MDSRMIWNSKKKKLHANFLFVSSGTGIAVWIVSSAAQGRPCDRPWGHLVDLKGLFVELELRYEKWFSEELVPILDYKRNFLFPLNNGSKCERNISAYCSQMMALLGWKSLYACIIFVKYLVGEGERERMHVSVCVCVRACVCFK